MQVGSYMTVTTSRLPQVSSSSSELALIKSERDELRARLLELEGEKRSFEECCLWAGEKVSLEEQVATLDGSVERFSHQFKVFVEEKRVLEGQADCSNKRLEEEIARKKVAE